MVCVCATLNALKSHSFFVGEFFESHDILRNTIKKTLNKILASMSWVHINC